jgi:DNA-binding beta-propeller fold protein YncE
VHKNIARGIAAVVASATLSAAGAGGAGLPGTAAAAGQAAVAGSAGTPGAAAPGSRLWIARYNGPPGTDNVAASMAVSPDGTRVFVTGYSARAGTGPGGEFATVSYKTATGARLWAQRYHGPAGGTADARSVAISPDGRTVFVTGTILNVQRTDEDYLTIAYSAATGTMRWIARYDGPGSPSYDQAYAVAVSRDGRTVFVTGGSTSPGRPRGAGSTTIAYRAADGARKWLAHYNGGGGRAVAVSPRGGKVIITGASQRNEYVTVAYRAATGTRLWARHHGGPTGARDYGGATALAFSPNGSTVFVTGDSHDPGTPHPGVTYATIAYRAADGTQLWATTGGPLASTGGAEAVAVSPDGRTVFVTGNNYATVAYRAATGAQLWASPRLDGSGAGTRAQQPASRSPGGYATALAVSPDGRKIFVTGPAFDPVSGNAIRKFTAVALGAATGARLWVNSYLGPRNLGGTGVVVAVSPDGRRVYVAGYTAWVIPRTLANRYTIIAYRA